MLKPYKTKELELFLCQYLKIKMCDIRSDSFHFIMSHIEDRGIKITKIRIEQNKPYTERNILSLITFNCISIQNFK